MTSITPARKGDLVALMATHRDYYIHGPSTTRQTVQFVKVASATRDGIVKTYTVEAAQRFPSRIYHEQVYVVASADNVDVQAIVDAARRHCFLGLFDSLEAAREFVRPLVQA